MHVLMFCFNIFLISFQRIRSFFGKLPATSRHEEDEANLIQRAAGELELAGLVDWMRRLR